MVLVDHFRPDVPEGEQRFPSHQFAGAMLLWAGGFLTRTQVINAFDLQASDEAQLDAIKAVYDAKGTAVAKLEYLYRLEMVLLNFEQGRITPQQAGTFLELS